MNDFSAHNSDPIKDTNRAMQSVMFYTIKPECFILNKQQYDLIMDKWEGKLDENKR